MKKKFFIIAFILISSSCVIEEYDDMNLQDTSDIIENKIETKSIEDKSYYWCDGEKKYLTQLSDRSFVIIKGQNFEDISTVASLSDVNIDKFHTYTYDLSEKNSINSNEIRYGLMDTNLLSAYDDEIIYHAPYFMTSEGQKVGISNLFSIKLKNEADLPILYSFAEKNNVIVVENNYLPLWHILACTRCSAGNSLEMANKAYESGLFAATSLDFLGIYKIEEDMSYNDPLFSSQWNLKGVNGLDISATHEITTGSPSVKLAVIDNGFQISHLDLNITSSWDATTQTSPAKHYSYDPNWSKETGHGTRMAGIIGAQINNGEGIVGIAPNVSLVPISVKFHVNNIEDLKIGTTYDLARAINHAVNIDADIINNSWTTVVDIDDLNDAVERALNLGRNGKGCIFIQASGNDTLNIPKLPYKSHSDIVCVGNIQSDGTRYHSSVYSEHLDLVAPGTNIRTTNFSNEYCLSTGTSPASAQVSAVAALMLSVNPDLTRQQVTTILEKTARKLPDYDFSIHQNRPHGSWNEQVGYGLVDCFDAVIMAQELDESNYRTLVEFDYRGSYISMKIDAKKDIAVIWDWGAQGISYIPAGTTEYVSYTYSSGGVKNVVIAEYIAPGMSPTTLSTALKGFELITGEDARNFNFKMINKGLENIEIRGGQYFATQEIVFSSLTGLKTLKMKDVKNASVRISNCPNLTYISNTTYIWGAPSITASINEDDTVSPYVVDGGSSWPTYPESVVSFASLNISGCAKLHTLSLENVGFSTMSFANLPKLQYVYLTSQADKIVGGASNPLSLPTRGAYLKDAINTLPSRSGNSAGRVLLRCISNDTASYIPVSISSSNYNAIMSSGSNKNWNVIWESGVQY